MHPQFAIGTNLTRARHQAISARASQKKQFSFTHMSLHGSGAPFSVHGLDAEMPLWLLSGSLAFWHDVVDTRVDMKLSGFSGSGEDWSDWCLQFDAYGALLGYETQQSMRHRSQW